MPTVVCYGYSSLAMRHDGAGEPRIFDSSAFGVGVDAGGLAANRPPSIPDHELIRRIGTGSYGEVWLARSAVGTYRAAKIVYQRSFENARPFEREFRGIQKFEPISRSHEGLVDVLQIGRNEKDGYFYYVMELADDAEGRKKEEGGVKKPESSQSAAPHSSFSILHSALEHYVPRTLRAEQRRQGRLPLDECVSIGLTLASALEHLHKSELVHRDIKPSNIIFVNGVPKLADIGLVADTSEAKSFVGTVGFIPPEGPGTPQADLYSLGKVLYEISTGKDRQDFPQLPADLRELSNLDAMIEFNEILLKACESEPRRRYQSAREIRADLELLQTGKSVKRRQITERVCAIGKRATLLVTIVLLLFASIVASIRHHGIRTTQNLLTSSAQAARPLRNRVSQIPGADKEFWEGWYYSRRGTADGMLQGRDHFKNAIQLDPQCMAAYNGLFEVSIVPSSSQASSWPFTAQEADAQLRAAARKLMELDNTMAEAHAAQAIIDLFDWKWDEAERGFLKAIRLDPNCAIAHMRYGYMLTFLGRPDEALLQLKQADLLDPILPSINKNIGHVFFVKRQFREAIAQYQKALQLQSDLPTAHESIGLCYIALGDYGKGIDEFVQQKLALGQNRAKVEQEAGERRKTLAESGPVGYWEKELERCQALGAGASHSDLAECYARLGKTEEAFAQMERAYDAHEADFISYPFFNDCWDLYRHDEKFERLLRKAGLAK